MGKLNARHLKNPDRVRLKSYEFGGHVFRPKMKVCWNWTSSSTKKDENGFHYVIIKEIFQTPNGVMFRTYDGFYDHDFENCVEKFDMRPYDIRPLTDDMLVKQKNGAIWFIHKRNAA